MGKGIKFFKNLKMRKWQWASGILAAVYVLTPACGSKNSSTTNSTNGVCVAGQVCPTVVGGYPLLPTPTYSALDPSHQTTLILSWAAPTAITAGTPYTGTVNIAGTLTLAPGVCAGLPSGGVLQLNGQGTWESGYGGFVARVQGNLNIVSGGSGTVSVSPALIAPAPAGGSYGFVMKYGSAVTVPFCGISYTYYD